MTWNPAFTWPIAFAVWAVLLGLAWARARRRRGSTPPRARAQLSPPPALHGEVVTDRPAFDSIYQVSPAPDGEGGENE